MCFFLVISRFRKLFLASCIALTASLNTLLAKVIETILKQKSPIITVDKILKILISNYRINRYHGLQSDGFVIRT